MDGHCPKNRTPPQAVVFKSPAIFLLGDLRVHPCRHQQIKRLVVKVRIIARLFGTATAIIIRCIEITAIKVII